MKSKPVFFLLVPAVIALLTFTPSSTARASAEDRVDQAVAASKAWVAEIDAGKYDDSYDFVCEDTRNRFPQDHWVDILKALRKPWGAPVSRQQLSHVYQPNGTLGFNGECVVVTYKTTFKHLDPATEVVVLKWEDGKWRGAGYKAGPTPDANASATSAPASNSTTETQTQTHVRPEPQQ